MTGYQLKEFLEVGGSNRESILRRLCDKYKIQYDELSEILAKYKSIDCELFCGLYKDSEDLFTSEIEPNLDIPELLIGAIDLDKLADNYVRNANTVFKLRDGRILSLNY